MFNSLDIVGNRFALLESVVGLLKIVVEKVVLFTNFPIGATMQDGGKRKRKPVNCSDVTVVTLSRRKSSKEKKY